MLGQKNRLAGVSVGLNSDSKRAWGNRLIASAALIAACGLSRSVSAQTYNWDSSGSHPANPTDGSGTWDTSAADWSNGTSDVTWPNAASDIAVFGNNNGTPGTVTQNGETASGITFNAVTGGSYNIAGSNQLTLFSAGILVNAGAGSPIISAPITLPASDTLTNNLSSGLFTLAGTVTLSGTGATLTFAGTGETLITGAMASVGGINVGSGSLVITQNESFTGGTKINTGATLQFGNNTSAGNDYGATGAAGTITDNGTLIVDRSAGNGTTVTVPINGSGAFVLASGGANLSYAGNYTYSGSTTVDMGTLTVGASSNLSSTSLVFGGVGPVNGPSYSAVGTLSLGTRTNSVSFSGGTSYNTGLSTISVTALGSSNTLALGPITRQGSGVLDITLPTSGSITTTTSNTAFSGGSSNIINGSILIPTGAADANWATSTSSGGSVGTISGFTGYTTVAGGGSLNPGIDALVTGTPAPLSTATTINSFKTEAPTGGGVTYTLNAPLTIASGGILFSQAGGYAEYFNGSGGSLTSGNGRDLNFVSSVNTNVSVWVQDPIVDAPNGSGGTTPIGLTATNLTAGGNLRMVLTASNTFSGNTNINATTTGNYATLTLLNPLALQNSTVNYNNGLGLGTQLYFGSSATTTSSYAVALPYATLGGLNGNENLTIQYGNIANQYDAATLNAGTATSVPLNIGNNGQNATYGGVLTTSSTINKIGAGVWTLTGANAIAGNTTISAGTLALAGSGSLGNSPVLTIGPTTTFDVSGLTNTYSLASSKTITGSGTINGPLSVASGGILTPGLNGSIGTLSTGNLTLASGSILNEIFGSSTNSTISAGNLTLPASGVTLNLFDNAGNNSGGSIAAGVYDILNYTSGGLTGFVGGTSGSGTFSIVNNTSLSNRIYSFSSTRNQIDLTISAANVNLTWTGANSGSWDTTTSSVNWANGTSPTFYANPNAVTFGDTSSVTGNAITNSNVVVQAGGVTPASVTFSANSVNYNISNASGDLVGINGSTGILKSGTDTVTLNGPNSFSGPVLVNAGQLVVANGNALGSIGAASGATVANGASLRLTGGITTNAQPLTINGSFSSSVGALDNLSGSNTYAGPIKLASAATISSTAGNLSVTGGINTNSSGYALTVTGPGNVSINTGAVTGSGSLNYTGSGVLNVSGTNTYTGGTVLNSGTLNVSSDAALGASTGGLTFAGNSTLQAGAPTVAINRIINVNSGVTATIDTNGNALAVGSILGSSANGLTKVGSGTLTLKGAATYGGTTTISGGTVVLSVADPVPGAALQIDASTLSGTVSSVPNLGTSGGSFSVYGVAPTLSTSAANQINGHQALVFATNGALVSNTAYTNNGNQMTLFIVEKSNNNGGYTGEASFIGPNGTSDYNQPGNLAIEDDNSGNNIRAVVPANQVPAELSRPAATPLVWDTTITEASGASARLTTNLSGAANVNTASGSLNNTSTSFNITQTAIGGRWSGASTVGSLFNGEIGEVIAYNTALSPTQTQAIESYLDAKWLGIGVASGNLPTATPLQVGGGATLDLNGLNQQVASLSGTGIVTSNGTMSGALAVSPSSSATFGGVIQNGSGTIGLTVNGTGTQILTGANTYTGPTTITSGKLVVGSGGTLGATPVTVSGSGIFAPNPGTASISIASLNLSNGGTVDMTDGAAGVLNLTGSGTALDIGSGATSATSLNFDLGSAGADKIADAGAAVVTGTNTINITALGSSLTSGTYPLISATGGLTGSFQLGSGSSSITVGSTTYSLALSDSATALNLVVFVPGTSSVWTGADSGNPTKWQDAGNWSGAIPGSTSRISNLDTVTFNSGAPAPVVDAGRNVQNITFDTGSVGQLNLTGSALTLSGNGVVQSTSSVTSDETISVPLVLEGNYSFLSNSANNNALILNGNISGGTAAGAMTITLGGSSTGGNVIAGSISTGSATSVALIKSGSGDWALNSANNFTGGTTLNSGVLTITNGALGSGSIAFSGGTLQYSSGAVTTDISGQITGSNAAISIDTNGDSVTFGSSLNSTNTGGLVKLNNGTLTLAGSNSYAGSTNVAAGALNIANSSALPSTTSVTVATGAALQLSGGVTTSSVPLSIVSTGVSGAGVIENLSGSNTYAGQVTMTGDATIGSDAGALNLSGGLTGSNTNLTLTGAGNITVSSPITTGRGTLTVNGPGTVALTAANTFTGGATLNGGVTQINGSNSLGGPTGSATINAATLEATSSFTSFRSFSVGSSTSTIQIDSGQAVTLAGVVSGGGTLNKTGNGTLSLAGVNTYGGGTNVNSGVLVANAATALGSGTVTLAGTSPTLQILPVAGVTGFGGASNAGWTLNVGPNELANSPAPSVSAGNLLTLTTAQYDEARSAFYQNPQPYNAFSANFVYRESAPGGGADGIAFVLQNDSRGAAASSGADDGFLDYSNGQSIQNSVALGWELYGNQGVGVASNGGAISFSPTTSSTSTAGLLASGDPIQVTITGAASSSSLGLTLVDLATTGTFAGQTYTTNYNLSGTLSSILGGTTAYVGFTGATGGVYAVQNVSNFTYTPAASTAPLSLGNNLVAAADSTLDVSYTNGVGFGSLTINSGNKLTLINSQASGTALVTFSSLANAGTLDITKDAVDLQNQSGNIGVISAQIAAAYHGGAWNGNSASGAITSSLAAADSTHLTAIGIATGLSTFEGQSVNTSDVLIKYTYYGDATLDGQVNSADYALIDAGFLSQGGSSPLTGWQNGDFNYDGVINGSDYTLIDNAFNTQGAQILAQAANPTASIAAQIAGGSSSAVPEPTTLGLLGVGAVGLLSRRRRRSM